MKYKMTVTAKETASSSSSLPHNKRVFVTVGTTKFDQLITAVSSPKAIRWFHENNYTHLTIQYGRGTRPSIIPPSSFVDGSDGGGSSSSSNNSSRKNNNSELHPLLKIRTYDFLPSLQDDMNDADLIISHAGAGTVMEALRLQKKLVVVINTLLMDNHQTELATAMADRGYLYMVEQPEDLLLDDGGVGDSTCDEDNSKIKDSNMRTWSEFDEFIPQPYKDGDDMAFPKILNAFMGFTTD
jgi:beta-1,4-N-acetylglucosaminyltransferase